MTFLAPWAMALGVAGALGAVLLHLVARQRPTAYLLPTARFIPDRQSVVSRAVSRPQDLLLLALRVLLLLAAGAAFARPVFDAGRARTTRVVLADQSAAVADPAAVLRRARELVAGDAAARLLTFDTGARLVSLADTVPRGAGAVPRPAGTITAALLAARREASALVERADSVELVLLSPVSRSQIDSATLAVRALWPGHVRIERMASRSNSVRARTLERAVPVADALGPALATIAVRADARAVRLRRGSALGVADSAFARGGGIVVRWDSAAAPLAAEGLAMADDVIVAPLGRLPLPPGRVRARWADGAPAAVEQALGDGCLRTVGVALPSSGDLPLRPGFQRLVRGLAGPCMDEPVADMAADSVTMARLAGSAGLAPTSLLSGETRAPSRAVPWLLGIALACALLELALRHRAARAPEVAT